MKIKSMAPQNLTRFFVVVSDAVPHKEKGSKDIVKEKKSRAIWSPFAPEWWRAERVESEEKNNGTTEPYKIFCRCQ